MASTARKDGPEAGQNANQADRLSKGPSTVDTGGNINVASAGSISLKAISHGHCRNAFDLSQWEALKAGDRHPVPGLSFARRGWRRFCRRMGPGLFLIQADNPPDAWKQAVQSTKGRDPCRHLLFVHRRLCPIH